MPLSTYASLNKSAGRTEVRAEEEELRRLTRDFLAAPEAGRHMSKHLALLSVAERLLELHGGELSVQPLDGVGTEYAISLPWKP